MKHSNNPVIIKRLKRGLIHEHIDHCLEAASDGRGRASRHALVKFKTITKYL